jgi:hypothetical protein
MTKIRLEEGARPVKLSATAERLTDLVRRLNDERRLSSISSSPYSSRRTVYYSSA